MKTFFRPENSYVGDVIPYYEDGKYYLFFLNDTRLTGRIADMTSWDLVITEDFVHYDYKGTVLPIGSVEEPDNCCYTGSVFKAGERDYHIFYTAHNKYCEKYMQNGHPMQTVMHATSSDLIHWTKHPDRFGSDDVRYGCLDWRDPFVYYNESEHRYNMLLAARKKNGSFRRGGCVLKCHSADLWTWEIGEPLYEPDTYFAHECPDLFRMNDWWYLVYSTFTERFATHYRMSHSINGPWETRVQDTWDARNYYAAKTAGDENHRYAFGWIPTREGRKDSGAYEWGGNLCVHELVQKEDGTLLVKIPDTILKSYSESLPIPEPKAEGNVMTCSKAIEIDATEKITYAYYDNLPEQCLIEADIEFEKGISSFGVDLNMSDDLDDGYLFRCEPFYNRVVFDRWPRSPLSDSSEQQHYLGGDIPFQVELERPLDLSETNGLHVKLLVENDIAVCYLNDTAALSVRIYNLLKNRKWGIFASNGKIEVKNLKLSVKK